MDSMLLIFHMQAERMLSSWALLVEFHYHRKVSSRYENINIIRKNQPYCERSNSKVYKCKYFVHISPFQNTNDGFII